MLTCPIKLSKTELLCKLVVPGSPLGLHTVCHAMQAYGWLVYQCAAAQCLNKFCPMKFKVCKYSYMISQKCVARNFTSQAGFHPEVL